MKHPTLSAHDASLYGANKFYGYHRAASLGEGELYDMQNLSSDHYPLLSTRRKRGMIDMSGHTVSSNILAGDCLCFIQREGGMLFTKINNPVHSDAIGFTYTALSLASDKQKLVKFGNYALIFPDKKYVTLNGVTETGDIEYDHKFTGTESNGISFSLCDAAGDAYTGVTSGIEPPEEKAGAYWIDTSQLPHSLKMWSAASDEWVSIGTTYVKITCDLFSVAGLPSEGDGVKISIGAGTWTDLPDEIPFPDHLNGYTTVHASGEDYIIIPGLIEANVTAEQFGNGTLHIERKMPEMDYIFEHGNRLWGCRYGENANGDFVNEIYVSKLGDFKNWSCYAGISTDSYTASVGTEGEFTGGISYGGYPMFFKENCIIKIYGSYPAQYQLQTYSYKGVQRGCAESLAKVGGVLYYKSCDSICAYDGSVPVTVSEALGDKQKCYTALAGGCGDKYYICMKQYDGTADLFVYDSTHALWHREDDISVSSFASVQSDLFFTHGGAIYSVNGNGTVETDPIEWYAETGILGTDTPLKKYISKIILRLTASAGSKVAVYAEYDSSGRWERLASVTTPRHRSFALPVRTRRSDHLRIRIEGRGDIKIYSLYRVVSTGSEFR